MSPSTSQAEEIGLKKGDQILEVNTKTFNTLKLFFALLTF